MQRFLTLSPLTRGQINAVWRGRLNAVFGTLAVTSILAAAASFAIARLVPTTARTNAAQRAAILAAAKASSSPDTVLVLTSDPKLAAICRPGRRALLLEHHPGGWRVIRSRPTGAGTLLSGCAAS